MAKPPKRTCPICERKKRWDPAHYACDDCTRRADRTFLGKKRK